VALIELRTSALAPGVSPVEIHYRDVGSGSPIVILHGGWGYEIYPFDRQIAALEIPSDRHPDRTGYGGSEGWSGRKSTFTVARPTRRWR
jgi:pimeloyl-ACP methyl ester carboxylesterase